MTARGLQYVVSALQSRRDVLADRVLTLVNLQQYEGVSPLTEEIEALNEMMKVLRKKKMNKNTPAERTCEPSAGSKYAPLDGSTGGGS